MSQDTIRVLRVLEYTGPRDKVEDLLKASIHGERTYSSVTIKAATIGLYPEILGRGSAQSFLVKTNRGWLHTWGPRDAEGMVRTVVCSEEEHAFLFDNRASAEALIGSINACYEPVIKEVK